MLKVIVFFDGFKLIGVGVIFLGMLIGVIFVGIVELYDKLRKK